MIVPKLPTAQIKQFFVDIQDFGGGTLTNTNESRANKKYAVESNNMEQYSDGVWRTRPGLNYYGSVLTATPDGAIEFEQADGSREIIAVANGTAYKSSDGGAWSSISGATFTTGYRPYFLQTRGRLYISNRTDPLAYYNGSNLIKFTALTDPSAPTGTLTTLTTGSYNNYYRIVSVNSVGFTAPSASLLKTTNKHRDTWTSTEKIALAWSTVTGTEYYQVYWGEFDGEELLIGEVATNSFDDTGNANYPVNEYIETPDDNTTAAPKFGPMELSGNRMWGTYDPDNEWRVYFSGTGVDFGKFSSFYGGGYIDLEKGGRYKPVQISHYRTGKGDPIITVLCKSPDGQGVTFQVELTSTTIGSGATATTFTVPVAYKIVGSIGSDAPAGVIKAGNALMFPNKKGVYFLQNQAQMFQVLSSDDATKNIRNKWEGINQAQISNIAGYYKPPRAYYSVALGSANDTTIVYDFELRNWVWAWNVGFKQFFEYTESNGTTRFLGVPTTGTKLVEISDNYIGDFGSPFYQSYISPLIPISSDKTDKAKVKYAVFEIGSLQGSVSCQVLGLTDSGTISAIASVETDSTVGTSGWGDDSFSDILFSDTSDTPTTFTQSTKTIYVRVNERLKAIQFKVSSSDLSRYEILRIQAKGTLIPGRPSYN